MTRELLALSLGPTCRAKYHLHRVLGPRALKGVFDWQVTPHKALLTYLERGFEDTFDLADLTIEDGTVTHRTLRTAHPHQFSTPANGMVLAQEYGAARERHEKRCLSTLASLMGNAPLLLVMSDPVDDHLQGDIAVTVKRLFPQLDFEIVSCPIDGVEGPDWRGADKPWNAVLRPFC